MAKKFNDKIKVREVQETRTPSKTESSIIGGIENFISYIGDDINTGFISLITGDVSKHSKGDLNRSALNSKETLFGIVKGIYSSSDKIEESIKNIYKSINGLKISLVGNEGQSNMIGAMLEILRDIVSKIDNISKVNNIDYTNKLNELYSLLENDLNSIKDKLSSNSSIDYRQTLESIKEKIESLASNKNISKDNPIKLSDIDYTENLNQITEKINDLKTDSISNKLLIEYVIDSSKAGNLDEILNALSTIDENIPENIVKLTQSLEQLSSLNLDKLNEAMSSLNSLDISLDANKINEVFGPLKDTLNENVIPVAESINNINNIDKGKFDSLDSLKDFVLAFNVIGTIYNARLHRNIKKNLDLILEILPNKNGASALNRVFDSTNNLEKLSDKGKENVESLKKFFESFAVIGNIDSKNLRENIKTLGELFKELDKTFDKLTSYDFSNDVDYIVKQLDYIEKVLNKKLEVTATAVENQKKNIDILNAGLENAKNTAIKGSKVDKKLLEEANNASRDLMDSIALLGLVMLLGGLIISKNEKLIVASLKFGLTLSLFLLTLRPAIKDLLKLSRIIGSPEGAEAIKNLSGFIFKMSLTMILGSLIFLIGNGKMLKASLLFGFALALFVRSLLLPIGIISMIVGEEEMHNVGEFGELVADLALVMVIGGLVVLLGGGKLLKASLQFGLYLMGFIAEIMLPFALYSRFFKNAIQGAKDISKLIVTCTLLMMIGAAIVAAGGGKYWKQALFFGAVLTIFMTAVITPIMIFGLLAKNSEKEIIQLRKTIILSSLLLILGALIGSNTKLVLGALKFAGVLFTYISLCILPFVFFAKSIKSIEKALGQLMLFITLSTILLLVGASVVNERPELILGALKFSAVMTLFIFGVTLPFLLIGQVISKAYKNVLALSAFILTATFIMAIGAAMIDVYGVKKLLIFPAILVGFTLLMALSFTLLAKTAGAALKAAGALALMAVSIAILSFTFVMIKNTVKEIKLKDILNFVIIVGIVVGVIAILSAISSFIVIGEAVALGLGICILAIASSLLLLHFLINKINFEQDFEKLKVVIGAAGEVFGQIGKMIPLIFLGFLSATFMSVSLIALSAAFLLVHLMTSWYNSAEEFAILGTAIKSAGETFRQLGSLLPLIALGMVSSILMTIGLISLGVGFVILHALVENTNPTEDIEIVNVAIDSLKKLFYNIGTIGLLNIGNAILTIGGFTLISTAMLIAFAEFALITKLKPEESINRVTDNVTLISKLINTINLAISKRDANNARRVAKRIRKMSQDLGKAFKSLKDLSKLTKDVNKDFDPRILAQTISIFGNKEIISAIKETVKHDKEYKKFNKSIKGTIKLISKIGDSVYKISKLSIPLYDENGKNIGKRQLNAKDFELAAVNVSLIMNTLSSSIRNVYDENKDLFDSNVSSGLIGAITGKKNKFDKVISGTLNLGKAISSIAKGVSNFVKLSIPLKYDSKGNPIEFRNMTTDDFNIAKENIKAIITTLSEAIASVYDTNAELFDSNISSGLIGAITGKKNKFDKVVSGVLNLGNAVSSIATALSAYASLSIPTAYDSNGNPISFRQMNETDFKNAAINISTIITTLANAIANVYNNNKELFESYVSTGIFKRIVSGKKNTFDAALSVSMNIADIISKLATGLKSIAELRIPIYDENGNIKSYNTIENGDFNKVSENIKLIITTIARGINEAYNSFDKKDNIKKTISSFAEIGNLIANLSVGVKNLAELNIPLYDDKGNIKGYRQLNETDFNSMSNNVKTIVTSTATALSEAKDILNVKTSKIDDIINAFTPISELLSSISETVIKYASGNIGKDGQTFNVNALVNDMNSNFSAIINGIFSTISLVYNNKEYNKLLKNSGKELNKMIKNIENIFKLIDTLTEYSVKISSIDVSAIQNTKNIIDYIIGSSEYNDNGLLNSLFKILEIPKSNLGKSKDIFNEINKVFKPVYKFIKDIDKNYETIERILSLNSIIYNPSSNLRGVFKDIDTIISSIITIISSSSNIEANVENNKLNSQIKLFNKLIKQILSSSYILINLNAMIEAGAYNIKNINVAISFVKSILNSLNTEFGEDKKINNRKILKTLKNIHKQIGLLYSINEYSKILQTSIVDSNINDDIASYVSDLSSMMISVRENLIGDTSVENKDLNKIFTKIEKYKEILIELSKLSFIEFYKKAEESTDVFDETTRKTSLDSITESIMALNQELNNTNEKAVKKLDNESKSLDRFVKAVNRIDISKAGKLASLMQAMANLADKMGGFDKLADALDGQLRDVLAELAKKVEEANKTIEEAKKFEAEKKKELNKNIEQISKLLDKSITVNVGKLGDDGTVIAGSETK